VVAFFEIRAPRQPLGLSAGKTRLRVNTFPCFTIVIKMNKKSSLEE